MGAGGGLSNLPEVTELTNRDQDLRSTIETYALRHVNRLVLQNWFLEGLETACKHLRGSAECLPCTESSAKPYLLPPVLA